MPMSVPPASEHPPKPVSRRAALAQLGAGSLALSLAAPATRALAQTGDEEVQLQNEDDVIYGTVDGVDLYLNVLGPADLSVTRPAVIIIHGGGLIQGGRYDHGEAATGLAQAGYVTFSIEYRLFVEGDTATMWPAQLDDTQRAVRWIRANAETYNIDPDRIGAFGYSSGGQLAAFLGARDTRDPGTDELAAYSSRVAAVVTLGGVFDYTFDGVNEGMIPINIGLLGGALEDIPDAYADFSPITFVGPGTAPFLMLQEGNQDVIPYVQPWRMIVALQGAGAPVTYSWHPDTTHDSWFNWAPAALETLAFYNRYLQPAGA